MKTEDLKLARDALEFARNILRTLIHKGTHSEAVELVGIVRDAHFLIESIDQTIRENEWKKSGAKINPSIA